jgi:tRNA (mo5U34)-methyltransferase
MSGQPFGINTYQSLLQRWPHNSWLAAVCELAQQKLSNHPHGDLPRWRQALERLPAGRTGSDVFADIPSLGVAAEQSELLRKTLMELHPWRKGPLKLGGVEVDTEWRSDRKWKRVSPHIKLAGSRVLDIGCGNGYFGLRMLEAGANLVVGIDPSLLFVMQWLACCHFSGDIPNYVLPLAIEDLPETSAEFDTVFSMGVLYHRKDPLHHLRRIGSLLRAGGEMVLETLVLPAGREGELLVPQGRYARMRNVWAIPGTDRLIEWAVRAGWRDCQLVSLAETRVEEQRSTEWMQFESLEQALDPQDRGKTLEGHPAPVRAVLIARN